MKYVTVSLIAGLFLVVGTLSIFASEAAAQGFTLTGKEKAYCRLTNVVYGKDLFSGICTVKEVMSETRVLFKITMGNAQPFQFYKHHTGFQYLPPEGGQPVPVRFVDRGHSGVFRWSDFRLEVDEFH